VALPPAAGTVYTAWLRGLAIKIPMEFFAVHPESVDME
jgi:hypothetical protein